MSEADQAAIDRRNFLKKFAIGAAVAPIVVTSGCFGGGGFPGHGGGNS